MGDNWDDDDFEVAEVSTFKDSEPAAIQITDEKPKAAAAPKKAEPKKAPTFAMESLGRELTSAEKEAMQKKNDLALARDMFGDDGGDDESSSYANISSKEEFEYWGERVGGFLATRSKAGNYGSMIGKLMVSITENLTVAEIQKISTLLTQITPATTAAAKKNQKKATLKVSKATNNVYDDYGGGADDYDDYDDFM
ncbi:unnamed protein product [Caenorhabditis angaria]|uniref:Eukaryotic translation initiation factor 3 30 kDa subunit n=1 Tax=Caenorhabditis angaria TaxID=860376 RepID=A0A9P1I6E2_9PELO|nr:unnamed protein product [Caenorhabditis angaria]